MPAARHSGFCKINPYGYGREFHSELPFFCGYGQYGEYEEYDQYVEYGQTQAELYPKK